MSELPTSTGCAKRPNLVEALPSIDSVHSWAPQVIATDARGLSSQPRVSFPYPNVTIAKSPSNSSNKDVPRGCPVSQTQGDDEPIASQIPERSRPPAEIFPDIASSFLNVEHVDAENVEGIQTIHKVSNDVSQSSQDGIKEVGVSFDDLVDRLLSQPTSKLDTKFAAIFLCLYRKFAAPLDLMSAIINRFERLDQSEDLQILRISSQLRYLNILAQWISDYPGDFAHALTKQKMASFIAGLAGNRVFAVASKEMILHLDTVFEDDDTKWAFSDSKRSRASTAESSISRFSTRQVASTITAESSIEDASSEPSPDQGIRRQSTRSSATPSTSSSAERSASQSTGSFQTLLNSVENSQRQAKLLTPAPRHTLTKVQWHQMMDMSDDDIASELTRIDWIMFLSIKPRDLVRHVILPADQKEKCRSLENVDRMINQFNHIAFWVANMILLRDKAKHRAKALEKFMGVAWVRQRWQSWLDVSS